MSRISGALVLDRVLAIDRRRAEGEEGLPAHTGRILDPALVGFGVAAARIRLVDRHRAGRLEASGQFRQLLSAFDLNAEMVDAGRPPFHHAGCGRRNLRPAELARG